MTEEDFVKVELLLLTFINQVETLELGKAGKTIRAIAKELHAVGQTSMDLMNAVAKRINQQPDPDDIFYTVLNVELEKLNRLKLV